MNHINPNKMKKYFLIASVALLASCGGGEPALTGEAAELGKLKTELETRLSDTQGEASALRDSIKLLTEQIAVVNGNPVNRPKVNSMTVSRMDFEHYFEVQGNIEAAQDVVLYAEAGGNIKKVHVTEGQSVKAGQTLVTFDTEIITRNIQEVETRLELALITYEKQKKLWEQNIGSEIQYLQAKNQKESLEQSIATLKSQRSKAIMTAPFSGTIDEIMPKVGEMAAPGMPVLRIVNLSELTVSADVNEKYLGDVAEGKLVKLHFPALGSKYDKDSITLKSWGRYINPNNRTFKITVDLPSTSNIYLPNLLVAVRVRDYQAKDVVAIPTKYILQNSKDENYVYVVSSDENDEVVAKRVMVEIGKSYKKPAREGAAENLSMTEIKGGLEGGEQLVTKGFKGIQDQVKIEVKAPEASK